MTNFCFLRLFAPSRGGTEKHRMADRLQGLCEAAGGAAAQPGDVSPVAATGSLEREGSPDAAAADSAGDMEIPPCENCGVEETPLWRKAAGMHVCNRCGTRWRRSGFFPARDEAETARPGEFGRGPASVSRGRSEAAVPTASAKGKTERTTKPPRQSEDRSGSRGWRKIEVSPPQGARVGAAVQAIGCTACDRVVLAPRAHGARCYFFRFLAKYLLLRRTEPGLASALPGGYTARIFGDRARPGAVIRAHAAPALLFLQRSRGRRLP